jgi:hypothetical protein
VRRNGEMGEMRWRHEKKIFLAQKKKYKNLARNIEHDKNQ